MRHGGGRNLDVTIVVEGGKTKEYNPIQNKITKTDSCWIPCTPGKAFTVRVVVKKAMKLKGNIHIDEMLLCQTAFDGTGRDSEGDTSSARVFEERGYADPVSNNRVSFIFPTPPNTAPTKKLSAGALFKKGEIRIVFHHENTGEHYATFIFVYRSPEFLRSTGHISRKDLRQYRQAAIAAKLKAEDFESSLHGMEEERVPTESAAASSFEAPEESTPAIERERAPKRCRKRRHLALINAEREARYHQINAELDKAQQSMMDETPDIPLEAQGPTGASSN